MPRVNVESVALVDPRYDRLAELLKLRDGDHARGRMLHIWSACTELDRYCLPRNMIDRVLGKKNAADSLIEAGLAEVITTELIALHSHDSSRLVLGEIRIRGTHGRVEWLAENRENARLGGTVRALTASRVAGKFTSRGADQPAPAGGVPAVTSPLPLPLAPALAPVLPLAPAQAEPTEKNKRESSLPASPAPTPVGPIEIHHDEDGAEVVWWGNPAPKATAPEPKPPPKQRATKMAEDWSPGPAVVPDGVNPTTELEKFRDWCRARGQRYVDWQAAWRNWLRKAGEFSARRPKQESHFDALDRAIAIRKAAQGD